MIGVIAGSGEEYWVEEFFELFKTPWEHWREDTRYSVVVCSTDLCELPPADLLVVYGCGKKRLDLHLGLEPARVESTGKLTWNGNAFPIYTGLSEFVNSNGILPFTSSLKPAAAVINQTGRRVVRIGYDLFKEVGFLLTTGQPEEQAGVPTLDIHIEVLRDLMKSAGVPFLEIPPAPFGCDFITCLTHDLDFAGIRNHLFDRTMLGFLYRALYKSFQDALRKKIPWHRWWRNLGAVLSLPAVFTGLAQDFWMPFDRYLELEKGLRSTYFLLPFRKFPGTRDGGPAPRTRGCRYDIDNLRNHLVRLITQGCEIGLHGIDAWTDIDNAQREVASISAAAGAPVGGARIHWLYFGSESHRILEQAGLNYDSSYGYNFVVGFRAGTAQAFQPPGTGSILELPLLIQDTTMFYPTRMNLSEEEASILCRSIVENVSTLGGTLVVNWHDRSLAPERNWGDFYKNLLHEIRERRTWFATCSEAAAWFRYRRRIRFGRIERNNLSVPLEADTGEDGHGFCLRVHDARGTRIIKGSDNEIVSLVP